MLTTGDFNGRIGKKEGTFSGSGGLKIKRNSRDNIVNKEGEILLQIIENNGWKILKWKRPS